MQDATQIFRREKTTKKKIQSSLIWLFEKHLFYFRTELIFEWEDNAPAHKEPFIFTCKTLCKQKMN